jgi:hypothetical protein
MTHLEMVATLSIAVTLRFIIISSLTLNMKGYSGL